MVKINDLELLKEIDIIYENPIVLYGAGNYGRKALKLLQALEISILGFCDSNITKWGKTIDNYSILTIQELIQASKEKSIVVIITMESPDNIEQVLEVMNTYGLDNVACYTFFALKHTIELHINDTRISKDYQEKEIIKRKMFNELVAVRRERIALGALYKVLSGEEALLVLQPGKVGSQSVRDSLIKKQISCEHIHTLTGMWGDRKFNRGTEGLKILHKIPKIKIISLVRDPIAQRIAGYFQSFREYILTAYADCFDPDTCKGVNALLEEDTRKGEYGAIFEWFNLEIKGPFGIDVYQYDFDKERGFQIIRQGNVELLLIKMEKLDECQEVIGQFVEVNDFKLIRSNEANRKLYRFAYNELKEKIKIPNHILDFYYKNNKAMDHFYTQKEKEQFRKKWDREAYK